MRLTATAVLAAFAAMPAFATVNVNTAQQSELQAVPGLDKVKAKTLIEYRNQHGPYRSLDDVAKALGPATAHEVGPRVAFNGPPYVPPPKAAKPKKKAKKRNA